MSRCPLSAVLAPTLLLGLASPAAAAEPEDYAGTFVLADRPSTDAVLAEAIDGAAEQFPALFRPLARATLRRAVQAVDSFTFEPAPNLLTIRTEQNPEGWTTDLAGTDVVKTRASGDAITLRRWMETGHLNTNACADAGCSRMVFVLADDARTMTLRVTTSSKRLEKPIQYELVYRRQ